MSFAVSTPSNASVCFRLVHPTQCGATISGVGIHWTSADGLYHVDTLSMVWVVMLTSGVICTSTPLNLMGAVEYLADLS